MPTLEWIGKKAVVGHHREVPFHLLKSNEELSVGKPGSGNLLVQGDNLIALKALLPYYAGKVKCIYIDPPYNTGNEKWTYNDNVNSPEIRQWLGRVVGGETEDLSRHDKWLCMMYPRLCLLREMLQEDAAIFVSIDDNELQNLRSIMDEIFNKRNFVATIIWQKVYSPKNTARHFSEDHDYIVVYAKNADLWKPNLVPRQPDQDERYKNLDNDPRGPWKTSDLSARNYYSLGTYSIKCPSGRIIEAPPKGMYWRVSKERFEGLDKDKRIWWGRNGDSIPQIKRFLSEVKQGIVPQTLWTYQEVGHTQEAKKELLAICEFQDSQSVFITPKPSRLIKRILEIGSEKDSLILDSFAGSGTTGHAVVQLNREGGGNRRFILVEMDETICRNVTAERLRRVCKGYTKPNSGRVEGLGGGFRYCELGEPLFAADGSIRKEVSFPDLARHVFFTETGEPLPSGVTGKSPLIGISKETAVYLLYNGILGDRAPRGGNVLTSEVLRILPPNKGLRVVYGTACRLSPNRLKREGVVFRQIPYEIRVS
jgi:site-specific DNA-methyltransferase (adenine-specific)/adenine-specific DNA-methyltransferase